MTSRCSCRYCAAPAPAAEVEPAVHAPIELPNEPRPFRVHTANGPQYCTLHPDGRLTMTAAGQTWVSALTFDEMLDMGWRDAHIDWDTEPGEDEPEPPAPVVEQADLFEQPSQLPANHRRLIDSLPNIAGYPESQAATDEAA